MSTGKLKELKQYLKALPKALPVLGPDARVNRLLIFGLDDDWVQDVGGGSSQPGIGGRIT